MKKISIRLSAILLACLAVISCKDDDTSAAPATGRSVTYSLFTGSSEWGYAGTVTFVEQVNGLAIIAISLKGPKGAALFPAHLHFGQYQAEADLAAPLNPVNATTGKSETLLKQLATGEALTYETLLNFDGHVKVHLGDGDNKAVVLVFGNIGSNLPTASHAGMAQCGG